MNNYKSRMSFSSFFSIIIFFVLCQTEIFIAEAAIVSIANVAHIDAIPEQYVVMLNTTDEGERMALYKKVISHGGHILHQYNVVDGFSAILPDHALNIVQHSAIVSHIEVDMIVRGTNKRNLDNKHISWGISQIDSKLLSNDRYVYDYSGNGVHVYVFDTGINPEHVEFNGRVISTYNGIADGKSYCGNHGTGVASIIGGESVGVSNGATLHSMRVLDCKMLGTVANIIQAMDWLTQNARYPAVVNMSLGSYNSTSYNMAIDKLHAKGIVIIAAAGNKYQYDSCQMSPGGAKNVITVAASDQENRAAWFTSMGKCVDLFAPGVDIYMATDDKNNYHVQNGTSYAAPHVTGCIARYLENNPLATPSELQAMLLSSASNNLISGDLLGTPNRLLSCKTEQNPTIRTDSNSFILMDNVNPTSISLRSITAGTIDMIIMITIIGFVSMVIITMIGSKQKNAIVQ